jgi:hypothetical protein
MKTSLPLVNGHAATYECIFGRGCDGICCQNGRPSLYPDEVERLDQNLDKFLPELRPEARTVLQEEGYLSRRQKLGHHMMRVVNGWCIFFNQGCTLHKVGAREGEKYRYKPVQCALFPLAKNDQDQWYVRQWGYDGEPWDLFCLNPGHSTIPAVESLAEEIRLAQRLDQEVVAAAGPARPEAQPMVPAH